MENVKITLIVETKYKRVLKIFSEKETSLQLIKKIKVK